MADTAAPLRLKIPERHKKPLSNLIALSGDSTEQLRRALERAHPTLSLEGLVSQIAGDVTIPRADLTELLALLLSICRTSYANRKSLDEVMGEVVAAASEQGLFPPETSEDAKTAFRERLGKLLKLEVPMGLTAKAAAILSLYERVYLSSTIVSDIRPVFPLGEDIAPQAAMVIHNVNIHMLVDDEHRSISVALDASDMRSLQKSLERALEKEHALRKVIESGKMLYLAPEPE